MPNDQGSQFNLVTALKNAVNSLFSSAQKPSSNPLDNLSPEEREYFADNQDLFYMYYPTSRRFSLAPIPSSATRGENPLVSPPQVSPDINIVPYKPNLEGTWAKLRADAEASEKALFESNAEKYPILQDLDSIQSTINAYYKLGNGNYNQAALIYKRDTGKDFNTLVNNRNSLQRASRTNVSTNLPETQQPSPGYRQPAATMATAPTVIQQPQQQHAYSSSNPAVLPTVTVYADKAKSIITDAVKKQAVTNMGYLLDINRARMNNPLLK